MMREEDISLSPPSSRRSQFLRRRSSSAISALVDEDDDNDNDGDGLVVAPPSSSNGGNHTVVAIRQGQSVVDIETASTKTAEQEQHTPLSWFVIQITAIASLGGILFGYDLGVVAAALPPIAQKFELSEGHEEMIVSILYVGGGIGALLGGSICDTFGRKRTIMYSDVVFGLGALILMAAPNIACIVLGRIVVGFAVAVSGIADVSYLHEIAPAQWRGAIVSVNEACISLGFLLAFGVGSLLANANNGWRLMFGISGIIAIIQYMGIYGMPESPIWLEKQGRFEEAAIASTRIRGSGSSDDHIDDDNQHRHRHRRHSEGETTTGHRNSITSYEAVTTAANAPSSSEHTSVSSSSGTTSSSAEALSIARGGGPMIMRWCYNKGCRLVYLLQQLHVFARETILHYRRQAYIAIFLSVTQQLCGQTNVLSYAPIIFARASETADTTDTTSPDDYVQGWATLSIGFVKFVVTVLVIWKIESIGRRVLLLTGMTTIAVGLLLLAVAFSGFEMTTTSTDQVEGTIGGNNGFYLAMPGVLLVVCGYSMSFGPLTWLLTSELFPTDIRGRALGFSTIVTYLCAALVTVTFLSAQDWFGPTAVFCFYLLVTLLGLIFAYTAIPDTKEKTTEQIEQDLNQMLWWRGLHQQQRTTGRRWGEDRSPLFGPIENNVEEGRKVHETELT